MNLALATIRTSVLLEKAATELLKPHGVTLTQFNVLNLLIHEKEGLSASELAYSMIVDPSCISGVLKRLNKQDLLRTHTHTEDRRRHIALLTAKGREVWSGAHEAYSKALTYLDETLIGMDTETCEDCLGQMMSFSRLAIDGKLQIQQLRIRNNNNNNNNI